MTLERFSEKGQGNNSRLQDPIISFRRSASIGINQSALEKFFGDADGAVMYFDEENEVVGIEPVESKDEDSAAYSITRKESTASISPGAFLEEHNLIPEVTTRYRAEWDDEEELILIALEDPVGTYGSPDEDDEEDRAERGDDDEEQDDVEDTLEIEDDGTDVTSQEGGDERSEEDPADQESAEDDAEEDTVGQEDDGRTEQGSLDDL